MRLETYDGVLGVVVDSVTVEDIQRAVAGLTTVGESYVILSERLDDEWYVQAAGTVAEDFIVERRDGCAGEHYRGDRRLTADELTAMLVGYLHGTLDWSFAISWHQVRVDFGASHAQA